MSNFETEQQIYEKFMYLLAKPEISGEDFKDLRRLAPDVSQYLNNKDDNRKLDEEFDASTIKDLEKNNEKFKAEIKTLRKKFNILQTSFKKNIDSFEKTLIALERMKHKYIKHMFVLLSVLGCSLVQLIGREGYEQLCVLGHIMFMCIKYVIVQYGIPVLQSMCTLIQLIGREGYEQLCTLGYFMFMCIKYVIVQYGRIPALQSMADLCVIYFIEIVTTFSVFYMSVVLYGYVTHLHLHVKKEEVVKEVVIEEKEAKVEDEDEEYDVQHNLINFFRETKVKNYNVLVYQLLQKFKHETIRHLIEKENSELVAYVLQAVINGLTTAVWKKESILLFLEFFYMEHDVDKLQNIKMIEQKYKQNYMRLFDVLKRKYSTSEFFTP